MCYPSHDNHVPVISSLGRGPKERWGDIVGDITKQSDLIALIAASGSSVSVSATGTSTNEVSYITINGTEYKMAGGGGGGSVYPISDSTIDALD